MYFSDVADLESHLNNDCTIILKNIKTLEDYHYDLLQYNRRILSKQRLEDDDPFINDEILQHHQYINKITADLTVIAAQQQEIQAKYESAVVSFQEIIKLMGRVGARILEMYQSSFDKCKTLDGDLMDRHLKMKASLVRLLNQKDKLNLEQITTFVYNYSHAKLANQMDKLTKLILQLQNGDYERAQGYQFKDKKESSPEKKLLAPQSSLSLDKKKISPEKTKIASVGKDEKVSPVWEEMKAQEKIRRQKQKVALRLVHGLYSTMQLARQQIIEDICSTEREKSKRLYNEILSRNKFNHDQIVAFEAKTEQFHERVRIFKEMMEKQSRKIAEALRKSSVKREKRKVDNLNFSKIDHMDNDEKMEEKEGEGEKKSSHRYRIQSPKSKGKTNEYPIIIQASQQNFNHIQFENSQSTYVRSNRNKLPFLHNISQAMSRAASFDQRAELNKSRLTKNQNSEIKMEKEEIMNQESVGKLQKSRKEEKYLSQRAKVPLRNIEVRVDGVMRQEVSPAGRQIRNMKPNPLEYTFYVRRNNRFYEPGHNIIY